MSSNTNPIQPIPLIVINEIPCNSDREKNNEIHDRPCHGNCTETNWICNRSLSLKNKYTAIGCGVTGTILAVATVATLFFTAFILFPLILGGSSIIFLGYSIYKLTKHRFHWNNIANDFLKNISIHKKQFFQNISVSTSTHKQKP